MDVVSEMLRSAVEVEHIAATAGKKAVCVIGAGASGLTVMKELSGLGHSVKCFEENVRIGGVYTKSYDRTMLTTSSLLTAYSDFSDGKEDKPKFWNDEEYLGYLDGFATEFDLFRHVSFRSSVKSITKCPKTGKWLVTAAIGGAHTWPHRATFLLGNKAVTEKAREEALSHGKSVLEDFHAKAEKEGFANMKGAYAYFYYDHLTGEKKFMDPADASTAPVQTFAFDAIAVCTGTNTWSSLPTFQGQAEFLAAGGSIVHSENYKKPEVYKGRRVLVVGAGESGSDICNEIADEAEKVAIVVRKKHGHLIPRKQADGRVTDLNTNRCRYSNPYILGGWVGWANQIAKKFVAEHGWSSKPDEERKVLAKIGELNLSQKTSAFSKFGCKNEGFVIAMVTKGAELHRDAFKLAAGKVVFADGSEFPCDDVVACTGYRNAFPFFEDKAVCEDCIKGTASKIADLSAHGRNPRSNFKQIFCPLFPSGEVAFFGFARPAFGAIPPTAEMQSRLYALVINGDVKLPDTEGMTAQAVKDAANWDHRFCYDSKRVKGLVDFQLYLDDLAQLMGSNPPLVKLFFTKPHIWWKIMFGPLTTHQYRLVGPYANPKRAEEVYAKQPVGDLLECSITAAFLITAKILSLVGLKEFAPNNF